MHTCVHARAVPVTVTVMTSDQSIQAARKPLQDVGLRLTSAMEPPQMGCMMRPYTIRAAKENQQPKMAKSGVNRRSATSPSNSPGRTGKVEVVIMMPARRQ